MPTYSNYNVLGASIETAELTAGSVTYDKLGSDVYAWEHIETLSPSGVATITTSGTLPVYEEYLLVIRNLQTNAVSDLNIQFNGDTAGNYYYENIINLTPTYSSAQNQAVIANFNTNQNVSGQVILNGKTSDVTNGRLDFRCSVGGSFGGAGHDIGLIGSWKGGNDTQLTSITIFSGSNFAGGDIEVFGRNVL